LTLSEGTRFYICVQDISLYFVDFKQAVYLLYFACNLFIHLSVVSESWNPQDKDKIFDVVRQTVGFNEINAMVCEQMRDWVIVTATGALAKENDPNIKILLKSSLGQLYYGQGKYLEAEPLFVGRTLFSVFLYPFQFPCIDRSFIFVMLAIFFIFVFYVFTPSCL